MINYNEKIICLNCNNLIMCSKNINYFVQRFDEIQTEITNKINNLNEKLIFILTESENDLIKEFRYSIKNKNIECNFCSNKIGFIENYKNYIYGILLNEKIKIKKFKIINNKILNDFNVYNIKDIIFKNKIQNLFKLDLMRKQYITDIIKNNYIPTREDQIKIENEDFIKKLNFINDNYYLEINK